MELDSVAKHKALFYRLAGTTTSDDALVENSESADDVFYLYATRGYRIAQRYLIDVCKMSNRWRTRSSALSWSGSETTDGGRYATLPTNFLRLWGDQDRSSIVQADGKPWGSEIDETESYQQGNYYYLKNDQLWITRGASPPTTVYLEYHHHHAAITSGTTTWDLPAEARYLGIAEGVNAAKAEGWFPRADPDAIREAVALGRAEAKTLRRTRTPIRMKPPTRHGTHW